MVGRPQEDVVFRVFVLCVELGPAPTRMVEDRVRLMRPALRGKRADEALAVLKR